MNQILFNKNDTISKEVIKNKKLLKKFKIQFYISLLLVLFSISYFLYLTYSRNKKENFSQTLLSNFNLERIYSNKKNYICRNCINNHSSI